MDDSVEFKIKNRYIVFKYLVAFLIISVALAVMLLLIITVFSVYEKHSFIWAVLAFPAFIVAVCVFGLYVYKKEEFSLNDGVFTYVKIFKKRQSVKVENIDYVIIRKAGVLYKVKFVNKKAETALSFLDDGTAFDDDVFINALNALHIPVKYF